MLKFFDQTVGCSARPSSFSCEEVGSGDINGSRGVERRSIRRKTIFQGLCASTPWPSPGGPISSSHDAGQVETWARNEVSRIGHSCRPGWKDR